MSEEGFSFPNLLSEFVYTRTYSRWLEEERRRETWPETVARYIKFIFAKRDVPADLPERARQAILNFDVLPSMRALWCAGGAMERDNTCGYNCSFLPIDNLKAFSEALYILMQGTGVGFSVERTFVGNLPVVASPTGYTVDYIIGDSTEGWADAVFFGITAFHRGDGVKFNYDKIRDKGARLKTKGGRASGPEPLKRVLDFAQETIAKAAGRSLEPIEAHDIMCMIAEIVMVGGFRRASLISFSDPDDAAMRHAKDWSRGQFPTIRYMANNSAVYTEKPTQEQFGNEWGALVASGSGERGFYIASNQKQSKRGGEFRSNPCVTAGTWVQTTDGPRLVRDLIGTAFEAVVDGIGYTSPEGFWHTGKKPVFRLDTGEGYSLRLTSDHRVFRIRQTLKAQLGEWVPAGDLVPGDLIRLNNHRTKTRHGDDRESAAGCLLGSLIGDGTLSHVGGKSDLGHVRFWGGDGEHMAGLAMQRVVTAGLNVRSDLAPRKHKTNGYWQVACVALADLASKFGVGTAEEKTITQSMEQGSDAFVAGLLSGLFDADGSVQGSQEKGVSVRLSQSNQGTLEAAQRILLRLGIVSTLYLNRREAGERNLPDGKGGHALYWCKAQHELVISNDNLSQFADVVGFDEPAKKALLEDLLGSYRRTPNRERFVATFKSLTSDGEEDVYDCSVPTLAAFDANGLYVHNCGEILLRFRRAHDPWTGEGGGGQFCNLTAAVMRSHDTLESMAEKVKIATWLGAVQSSYNHFPYLRPAWSELCEEDRLLGVDITGQCDHPALSGDEEVMHFLNATARATALIAADRLQISRPAAITCGKPSGNSSQFVDCSSGFHPRHAKHYFRHVRISGKDPLFRLIRDFGVPLFKENGQEELPDDKVDVWVARFPVKAPETAMTRGDESALDQLNRYLKIMKSWCGEKGHNQSATIYVREEEWAPVGEWLWNHFDEVTGLSFLPYDGGHYRLAPYVEISEEEYLKAAAEMPDVNFRELPFYETMDEGNGAQEPACMNGSCDI